MGKFMGRVGSVFHSDFNVFYMVMEFIKTEEKHECGFTRDQSSFQKGLVHPHLSHFPEHSPGIRANALYI